MKDKLLQVFPEFELIKDNGLKEKTLAVWVEAIKLGGWQVEDLDKIPFTLLIPGTDVSLLQHIRAVTQTAIQSAQVFGQFYRKNYSLNMDYIVIGGLLHDVGKVMEYKRDGDKFIKSDYGKLLRHPFSGAGLAIKHGLPEVIPHIIATHAKEGDGGYRCPESVIVHYADFMNFEPLKK